MRRGWYDTAVLEDVVEVKRALFPPHGSVLGLRRAAVPILWSCALRLVVAVGAGESNEALVYARRGSGAQIPRVAGVDSV